MGQWMSFDKIHAIDIAAWDATWDVIYNAIDDETRDDTRWAIYNATDNATRIAWVDTTRVFIGDTIFEAINEVLDEII